MTRLAERARQLAALVALAALLVGVPIGITALVGNSGPALRDLAAGQATDRAVIAILAAVVALAWLQFALCVVTETLGQLRRRGDTGPAPVDPRVPGQFTGLPALARTLVATALFAGTLAAVLPRPALAASLPPPGHPYQPVTAAVLTDRPPTRLIPQSTRTPPPTGATGHPITQAGTPPHAPTAAGTAVQSGARAATQVYVVPADGDGPDTLWDIADQALGSGERWHEIWDLNRGRTQPDGTFMSHASLLRPGWTVLIPAPDDTAVDTVTVRPGDTLTGIANNHHDSLTLVWDANEGRVMSDGRLFTDPDLIKPGDTLVLPTPATTPNPPAGSRAPQTPHRAPHDHHEASAPVHPTSAVPRPGTASRPSTPTASAPTSSATSTGTTDSGTRTAARDRTAASDDTVWSSPWATVFGGGGGIVAAGVLTTLLARRRAARRRIPIGHVRAQLPPPLAAVAHAAHVHAATSDGALVDLTLRGLAAAAAADGGTLPDIATARLIGDRVELALVEPHPHAPPSPWQADESGLCWSVRAGDPLPVPVVEAAAHLHPYPTLVTIAESPRPSSDDETQPASSHDVDERDVDHLDGHQSDGRHPQRWLLDLEHAAVTIMSGDPDRCRDLARFVATSLAVNDNADTVTVTLVGFGDDLVGLNPHRLRHSTDLRFAVDLLQAALTHASAAAQDMDALTSRVTHVGADSFMPHVLIADLDNVATNSGPDDMTDVHAVRDLATALAGGAGRVGVAVVLTGGAAADLDIGTHLVVDADTTLLLPDAAVPLQAQQMPADMAAGIAAMLAAASDDAAIPVPNAAGDQPADRCSDASGALRRDLVLPRTTDPAAKPTPSGDETLGGGDEEGTTLLPEPDTRYLQTTATTRVDLETISPRVPAAVTSAVEHAVDGLDADLERWHAADCDLPRLTLLGPIELRAHGEQPKNRRSYLTEIVAFLATRPHGATAEQLAAAFNLSIPTTQARIREVRAWLGPNPRTGRMHLPDARRSAAGRQRGINTYELEDLLVDADLFCRLHARGQARGGHAGIADYEAALRLVTAPPFDQARPGGYEWLLDDRHDEYLAAGIEKIAHTVATWALEQGQLDRAEYAATIAINALPYADTPRHDLAAVLDARGLTTAAERLLRDDILNRDDNGDGPDDPTPRTADIMGRRAQAS
ncbi:MAG: LysM peptidoglycan-binding domain-containing protein [Jatrophihabitans sp.]|uniref:LysM peptidoglycan-binding domain-containing protein n=1 Tax=Jatrophihabitans sp. TaxID=1932789 RepID=UPI003F7FBFDB